MKVMFVHSQDESLAVESLSAFLKANGHETDLVFDPGLFESAAIKNAYLQRLFDIKMELVRQVKGNKPGLVAFSVNTVTYQWALQMARLIKNEIDVPTIFGGIHVTSMPDRVINREEVDFLCVGEGEYPLLELVNSLDAGKVDCNIKNIWFKKDGVIIKNDVRPPIDNLDTLPFLDKGIFYSKYKMFSTNYMTMTARGCPYSCTYCCNDVWHAVYKSSKYLRRRSVDNVIEELLVMKNKYRIKRINFFDDVFVMDTKWLKEFSEKYKEKIGLPFGCMAHCKLINLERAKLLKDAGCYAVSFGLQTANEESRKNILKRIEKNDDVRKAASICHTVGLKFLIDHIFGIPFEGDKEHIEAISFYNEIRPTGINTYQLAYFPTTSIINTAKEAGMLTDNDVELINEGKAPTSTVVGIGNKESLNIDRNREKYNPYLILLPILPKKVVDFVIRKNLYNKSIRIPRIIQFCGKLIVRIKAGQGFVYCGILLFTVSALLKTIKFKKEARNG